MRILTVRQPWAEAIVFGGKDIENRSRNVAGSYRGPVAIHTAKYEPTAAEWREFERRYPEALSQMMHTVPWSQEEFGVIIGVVDLVDAHGPHSGVGATGTGSNSRVMWGTWAACSKWAEPDSWHLVLANRRPLSEPIPYRGALGLRHLGDATTSRIRSQLGDSA